ncbi:MAG: TonB-dependent receptor [Caulobacteraceae bacterium]|nr:TonB-dependent receptor [Caulobacteraceae bacterium]
MRGKLFAGVSAGCLAVGLATGAAAQARAGDGALIEELVVTAEKRETNLQTTALAVSAVSGEQLQRQQVTSVEALAQLLPNVNFGATTGNARIAIRGIGFDNSTVGGEGRVAYHLDGVYVSRPAAALGALYDIERIEVLRGPQGTLYGRNATGGAINVIGRDPGAAMNGYLTGTVGSYELFKVEGAIGGPIADTVGFRLAFQTHDHDGYGRNITNGLPVDDMQTRAVKGRLVFEPSERLRVTLSGDYMTEQDHAYSFHLFGPGSLPEPVQGLPGAPLKGLVTGGRVATDPRDSAADIGPGNDREFYGFAAHVETKIAGFEVTSITGLRRSEFRVVSDLDATSAPLTYYDQEERSDTFSQELRVSRDWGGGDLMIGAYYFDEDLFGGTRIPLDRLVLAPPPLPLPSGLRQGFFGMGYIDTKAYAVFGHVRLRLGEAFAIRLGGRYSDEKKSIDEANKIDPVTPWPPYVAIFPSTPPGARRQTSASWSDFNPSVTLEYRPSEDLFLYATYSEGFKSGGYNLGNLQPPSREQHIVARAAIQLVVAGPAGQDVLTLTAVQDVVAALAVQQVVAAEPRRRVVTVAAEIDVVARLARPDIIARTAEMLQIAERKERGRTKDRRALEGHNEVAGVQRIAAVGVDDQVGGRAVRPGEDALMARAERPAEALSGRQAEARGGDRPAPGERAIHIARQLDLVAFAGTEIQHTIYRVQVPRPTFVGELELEEVGARAAP